MIPELRFLANAHHPSRGSLTFQTPTVLIAFDRLTFSDRFLILFFTSIFITATEETLFQEDTSFRRVQQMIASLHRSTKWPYHAPCTASTFDKSA